MIKFAYLYANILRNFIFYWNCCLFACCILHITDFLIPSFAELCIVQCSGKYDQCGVLQYTIFIYYPVFQVHICMIYNVKHQDEQ